MAEVAAINVDAESMSVLDAALARSRQIDAPVFLYWGTKWCPPCAELQATVLKRSSFHARLAGMVALDIDGDALGAQACGERLDTEVYPTLLVLGGDEREWIRMPCGLSEETFCAVIDAALRRRTPMAELAQTLGGAAPRLKEDDLTLLAFHYWPQDRRVYSGSRRLAHLDRLQEVLPAGSESAARTLTWQLVERAARPGTETAPAIRHRLFDRLQELLQSRHATYSTLYYLLVGLESVVELLCENDGAGRRRELSQSMEQVLLRLVEDPTLSWTERLIAQSASVSLRATAELPGGPADLVDRTRALVARADAATTNPTERQSAMNMAGHLLRQSGLREESLRLFCAEIGRSPWPTYFMPYVAEIYMEENDREEALRWWRRSYEETVGKTTRFELGARYIAALARHAPQERALIDSTVAQLFSERGDDVDMARARIRKSLGLLARTLASLGT